MRFLTMTIRLAWAAAQQFWKTEVHEVGTEGDERPPIRYDGDPRDIYLA